MVATPSVPVPDSFRPLPFFKYFNTQTYWKIYKEHKVLRSSGDRGLMCREKDKAIVYDKIGANLREPATVLRTDVTGLGNIAKRQVDVESDGRRP